MTATPRLPAEVLRSLAAVRRRRRALALVQALAWTALGLACGVLLLPALRGLEDTALAWARGGARLWVAAWILGPLIVFAVPAWRRTHSLLSLARAVDDRVPETSDSLFAAVDLAGAIEAGRMPETSRALAERHLDEAAQRAGRVDAAALLPMSMLGRRTLIGPGVAGLALLLFAVQGPAVRAGFARIFGPAAAGVGEAADAEADLATLLLKNIRIELVPPAYSGAEPLVLEGTTGDFQALAGTRVQLQAELPRSGRGATVQWIDGESWAARADGKLLIADWVTPGGGEYRVLLQRGLGASELQTRAFRVELLPDNAPSLEVSAPAGPLELRPEQELPLGIVTEDDFGLTRLELVVEQGGRVLARAPIWDVSGSAQYDGVFRWIPQAMLQEQGGELELVVEAWDNDTVNGPKVTRSRPVEVWVPTPRDHHRRVQTMKEDLVQRSLDLLADLLVDTQALEGRVARRAVLASHDRQNSSVAALLDAGQALGAAMAEDRFERADVFMGIGMLLENLARTWGGVDEYVESSVRHREMDHLDGARVARLTQLRTSVIFELARIVPALGASLDLQRGEDALDQAAGIEPAMADLADLLRQASEGKPVDEAVAQALKELQQRIAELAAKLAERSPGPDDGFLNQLPKDLDAQAVDEISKLIEEGRFDEAIEKLQQAMEALDKTMQALEAERDQMAGGQRMEDLQAEFAEAIAEAKELEQAQEQVIAETEDLERRFGSGDGLDPETMEGIEQDMARLREDIGKIAPAGLPESDALVVRRWERMAAAWSVRMQEAFAQGSLQEAADFAETTGTYAGEMGTELEFLRGGDPTERAAGQKRAQAAEKLAQGIARKLEEGVERARRARAQAAKAGEGTQAREAGVQDGVRGLRGRMGSSGSSAFNPVSGRENLQSAEQLMEKAGARLRSGRAGRALAAERDGLKQLQSFRQSLEQASEAMQSGGRMGQGQRPGEGRPGGRGQPSPYARADALNGEEDRGQDVELSDPDDFVSPEAFRKLVQEGAASDAPERYRPINRGYYEELVR